MALTSAERQRRSRAHKSGDHSLCDPKRCESAGAPLPESLAADDGLGDRGRRLWREMTAPTAAPLGPAQLVLLEEACRIADRLDRLDRMLRRREDDAWLNFHSIGDGAEVVRVVLDNALGEARQQATALRGLVAELARTAGRAPRPAAGPVKGAQGGVADLTARIADRRSSPTG